MKFKSPMLVVSDINGSKAFYKEVLGLRVISDFGANITLTGGVSLQTKEKKAIKNLLEKIKILPLAEKI